MALPRASDVQTLAVYPAQIALKGGDDAQQLILTAVLNGKRLQDLTGDVTYAVANPKIARVSSMGRVVPLANGSTEITARYGDKHVTVAVERRAVDENLPINFANQIVPIFTKLGCNTGGCHGKASGQNGFKLSLLGLRAGSRLRSAGEGSPRPASLARPRPSTACCCSRRPARSRTAAANAWRPTPTNTSSSAAGSPPACRSAAEDDPDRHQDHRSIPSTAS